MKAILWDSQIASTPLHLELRPPGTALPWVSERRLTPPLKRFRCCNYSECITRLEKLQITAHPCIQHAGIVLNRRNDSRDEDKKRAGLESLGGRGGSRPKTYTIYPESGMLVSRSGTGGHSKYSGLFCGESDAYRPPPNNAHNCNLGTARLIMHVYFSKRCIKTLFYKKGRAAAINLSPRNSPYLETSDYNVS